MAVFKIMWLFYINLKSTVIYAIDPMRLITTHINADFDGLASMIAVQKLYSDAVLSFPGSQERNVREYISQNLLLPDSCD